MKNSIDIPKYLSQEEVKKFLSQITDSRDRALFGLIYHYGLRVTEATLLTINDANLQKHKIFVRRLKGGVSGEKPLWRHTAKLLRAYLRERIPKGTALFTGREGPIKKRRIEQLFQIYAKKANLNNRYTVHSLRHSIAVHLLDAGQPLELVQDHLGHRYITNTQVYARISNPRRDAFFHEVEYHPAVVRV